MMYALIQDDDVKSRKLAKEIQGIELYIMKGSTNLIPYYIITQIIKRRRLPKALILRYLNDSNSLIKSLLRFITNIISVLLVKILRIKLIWICHNVDRESKEFFPYLIRIRRKVTISLSDKIFVTDKLLIKHASKILKVNKEKIDYITFGKPDFSKTTEADEDLEKQIMEFVKNKDENTLIGLAIGNPNKKVLQPFYTDELINRLNTDGNKVKIILGGPLGNYIKQRDLNIYKKIINNPNILFLDCVVNINEEHISRYIDFYWRVYDDFSVPFTVYNAVYLEKPILTMDKGFLKEMVLGYDIGYVIKNDFSNVLEAVASLKKDRSKEFSMFIESNKWSVGARNIMKAIKE